MTLANLARYWFLVRTFINGPALVKHYRDGSPCSKAILWSGRRLIHPPQRSGLVGTILELWHDQCYTGSFYHPSSGDVIIDAGAHVGLFSILVARQNPDCRVVALEPFEENHACLVRNLQTLGVGNVEVHKAALAGQTGVGRMRAVGDRSIDHLLETGDSGEDDEVATISLPDLFETAGTDRIAMLKCDVEGSEYDAFGAVDQETLARIERIGLEYHDNLRPGTLDLLKERLSATHELRVQPEPGQGHGLLYAVLRNKGED